LIILSIDLGKTRTGLAVCDELENFVYPWCTINERNKNKLINIIIKKSIERSAKAIVIGYPRNMDGTCGFAAEYVKNFAEILKNKLNNIEFYFHDERLTTIIAKQKLNSAMIYGKKRKEIIDTVAAAEILQDFLHSRHLKN
jgi:putative Holliday junction resolvase